MIFRRAFDRLAGSPGRAGACLPLLALILAGSMLALLPETAGGYNIEKQNRPPNGRLALAPATVEVNVKPGDSATRDITLTNGTSDIQTLTFSVQDFEGSTDPSQAFVLKGDQDGKFSARHWIEPELTSINLNPGEQLTFRVNISVPAEARPGGRYAALIVSPAGQPPGQSQTTSSSNAGVLTLFLITVEGNVIKEGTLNPPEVPALAMNGPIDIGLVFDNQGNVHLKPHGTVTVTNMLGQTSASINVPEWVVLPDSSRRETVSFGSGLLFGRYSVKATVQYGDGATAVVTASFWAFSWELLLALLAVLAIIAYVAWRIIRRRRRGRGAWPAGTSPQEGKPAPAAKDKTASKKQPAAPGGGPARGGARQKASEQNLSQARDAEPGKPGPSGQSGPGKSEAGESGQPGEAGRPPAAAHLPLGELFPFMADERIVDITDSDTKKLICNMIDDQIGLARAYLEGGDAAAARRELEEARAAAEKLGLFSEMGLIEDILRQT